MVRVSGWGKWEDGGNSVSTVLREVEIPIADDTDCSGFYGINFDTKICTSVEGHRGTCNVSAKEA